MITPPSVSEKPILFSAPMVRAILDGRKTQTRRVVKKFDPRMMEGEENEWCPYWGEGDRLWVKETFQRSPDGTVYRATESDAGMSQPDDQPCWKPSIFMPRKLSRITLEIVKIRVERLQQISEADAIAEGVDRFLAADRQFANVKAGTPIYPFNGTNFCEAKGCYQSLWDSINEEKHPWASNPWVWVIEFRKL